MSNDITINLSRSNASTFKTILADDLEYYRAGLELLKKLDAVDDKEFGNALREADCPLSWTREDVKIRIENTNKVVETFEDVINQIEKTLD